MTLRLSVIVPVYNGADLIGPCLDAIRGQEGIDRGDFEIIVVDDGSTDDSAPRAEPRCDRLVRLETNRGAAAARNAGAVVAGAPLLLFVDADVVLEPGAVKVILDHFEPRPDLDAAVGGYTEVPVAPGLVNLYHNAFTRYHHDLSRAEIDWFWGALGAVRKEAFAGVGGFDERYQGASAEDIELGRALSRAGHIIAYLPEARGAHAHHFTMAGMFKNDFQKTVLGVKLYLGRKMPRRGPGFAYLHIFLSMVLVLGMPLVAGAALAVPRLWPGVFLAGAGLGLLNLSYYRYLRGCMDGTRLIGAIGLHWLQLFAIGAGSAAALAGHLLGRDTYGRPGWI